MVKPYSVTQITSKIRGKPKYKQCVIIPVDSEGILFDQPGLMLTNLIAKVNKKKQVPMVLVNHTDRTIVLKKAQTLGVAEDLNSSEVSAIESDTFDACSIDHSKDETNKDQEVKENNDPLEGIKLDHLSDENLLLKYEKLLFAKSTKDLGHTDLVELSIDTGNATPIK